MPTSSSTGGYLLPTTPPAPEDAAFENVLQGLVAGITGLDPHRVRPRWQPDVPKQPEPNVDWCAIGVMSSELSSTRAQSTHIPTGDGSDIVTAWEYTEVLASFYGPNAWRFTQMFDMGLRVEQNRVALFQARIGLRSIGNRVTLTELVNQRFVRRVDISITLAVVRQSTYPVLNLLRATGVTRWQSTGRGATPADAFDSDNAAH